jgi:hypothetical protein
MTTFASLPPDTHFQLPGSNRVYTKLDQPFDARSRAPLNAQYHRDGVGLLPVHIEANAEVQPVKRDPRTRQWRPA